MNPEEVDPTQFVTINYMHGRQTLKPEGSLNSLDLEFPPLVPANPRKAQEKPTNKDEALTSATVTSWSQVANRNKFSVLQSFVPCADAKSSTQDGSDMNIYSLQQTNKRSKSNYSGKKLFKQKNHFLGVSGQAKILT